MKNKYIIFGIGYVGLSNAVMLSINSVTIIDIDEEKIKRLIKGCVQLKIS